jgi:hypothetical protein
MNPRNEPVGMYLNQIPNKILNACFFRQRLQYLVKWWGYDNEDNEWVSVRDVHAPEAVQAFYQRHPNAVRLVRSDRPWQMHFEDALDEGLTPTFIRRKPASVGTWPWRGGDVRGHLHFCLAGHYNLSEALFPSVRILSLLRSSSSPCEARSHPRSSFADYLCSFADYPHYFTAHYSALQLLYSASFLLVL